MVIDRGVDSTEALGRRAHKRYQTPGAVRLSSPSDADNQWSYIHIRGTVLDISEGGISLRSEQKIPEDSHVDLDVYLAGDDGLTLSGTVVHCTQSVDGFSVGIELQFPG